eukprot:TRINITY_DN24519_c0_g1_i1.p1 TRINITY_DN24519_c0_g1~~TRINITY_DN24519_c0_g1_i1.p1  ORF type:complete len:223 (+),score=15.42 TRINITY_DN24519_c0_g1_i1:94-762(+)
MATPSQKTIDVGPGIKLRLSLFESADPAAKTRPLVVCSHPATKFGGQGGMMAGIARELAARCGLDSVWFDHRGAGQSSGSSTWTGWEEVEDCVAVCGSFGRPCVIVGSSGLAPAAGTAAARIERALGYVGIGYTCGVLCSILWRGHYRELAQSKIPKLFIHASKDEHTSPAQVEGWFSGSAGFQLRVVDNVGHYELEQPRWDSFVADCIAEFVFKVSPDAPS